jgi:hypothetical protein
LRPSILVGTLAFSSPCWPILLQKKGAYNLAPGDKVTVTVFGQPELSGDLLVDRAGSIMLPFIGGLEIKDLTVIECQKLIHDRLADGILPQPSVNRSLFLATCERQGPTHFATAADSSFKRQTMADLRNLHDRLRELDVTLPSAREIRQARLEQAEVLGGVDAARSFSVTRIRNCEASAFEATETTLLAPGNILEVGKILARELSSRGPAVVPGGLPSAQLGEAALEGPVALSPR